MIGPQSRLSWFGLLNQSYWQTIMSWCIQNGNQIKWNFFVGLLQKANRDSLDCEPSYLLTTQRLLASFSICGDTKFIVWAPELCSADSLLSKAVFQARDNYAQSEMMLYWVFSSLSCASDLVCERMWLMAIFQRCWASGVSKLQQQPIMEQTEHMLIKFARESQHFETISSETSFSVSDVFLIIEVAV